MIGVFIVLSLLPSFNNWAGIELKLNLGENPALWLFLLLLPLVTAIVAGLYPAFYISSFEPIGILKGQTTFGPRSRVTRVLLFVQFTISCVALIIGLLMAKNAAYQDKADFGYAINEVIVTKLSSSAQYGALRNAVKSDSRVIAVGGTTHQIADGTYTARVATDKTTLKAQVAQVGGQEYLHAMGITLVNGRHFYPGQGVDKDQSIIVNQTLVSKLHLDNPLGTSIQLDSMYYTIVGVVADYKEFGLHGRVPPCVLRPATEEGMRYMVIRARQGICMLFTKR